MLTLCSWIILFCHLTVSLRLIFVYACWPYTNSERRSEDGQRENSEDNTFQVNIRSEVNKSSFD